MPSGGARYSDWNDRLIYLVRSGSYAYGTNMPDSDTDTRGVCIPPAEYIIGLKRWEMHENKEIDQVIYSLHKFVRLALENNPNILELLYVREEDILHITPSGRRLRDMAPLFLSQKAYKTFGGYAHAQLLKLSQGKTARHGSHVGLLEKYGYDVKHAMHLIRLLRMGVEILSTGQVYTYRPDRSELLAIRNGEWTLGEVLAESARLGWELQVANATTILPEEPDFDAVNQAVMDMVSVALEGKL